MADQAQYSINEIRNIKAVDNGDGTFSLAVSLSGGSSGGGAVTIADGADATFGAKADAAAVTDTETATYMALFKRLLQRITSLIGLYPTSLGTKTAANSFAITPSSDGIFLTKPFDAILPYSGTLIGTNTQIDTNRYSASVQLGFGSTFSGEILNITLLSQESGTGSIQAPQSILYIFKADPTISANATTIDAGDWSTCIGSVSIAAADWVGDTNGKVVTSTVAISFEGVTALYASLYNLGSAINDAAGDDEYITISINIRRDS